MAELNDTSSKQLPAFTIIESLVAMAILVIAFSIGIYIFLNVSKDTRLSAKTKAALLLENWSVETHQQLTYIDEEKEQDGLFLEKKVNPYPQFSNVYILEFSAKIADETILSTRELILSD